MKMKSIDYGQTGEFEFISVDDLRIDGSYQRPQLSDRSITEIARRFEWGAFGTLEVRRRADGANYVVDGQQRLAAAKMRGDIDEVPCMVFPSSGPREEALAFISHNTKRAKVSSVAKFLAAVRAGNEPEAEINDWLSKNGWTVDESPRHGVRWIRFTAEITSNWSVNRKACQNSLLVQREISPSDRMNVEIYKGMYWLFAHGVDVFPHVEKIRLQGGRVAILQAIKAYKIEVGQRQASRVVLGRAILQLINNRRRLHRITVETNDPTTRVAV